MTNAQIVSLPGILFAVIICTIIYALIGALKGSFIGFCKPLELLEKMDATERESN